MQRSFRWIAIVLILSIVMPMGTTAKQVEPDGPYTCPTEVQDAPTGSATSATIRGVEATEQGQPQLIDEGERSEHSYTVVSTDYVLGADYRNSPGALIVICLKIEYSEDATDTTLQMGLFRLGLRGDTNPSFPHYYATGLLNGVDPAEALAEVRDGESPDTFYTVDFSDKREQTIPIVFDQAGSQELYLTAGDPQEIATGADLDWAMLITLQELSAENQATQIGETDSAAGTQTGSSGSSDIATGTVTEFSQPTVITLGLEKWRLTFDPAVEVRTSIAGAIPQRGQFLVIWFDQFSTRGDPLPLGNFTLQTSTDPNEPFAVRGLSEEGTTALILTEYTWSPDTMSASTEYRTGIAFDIAPEDTHFTLQFRGPAGGLGNDYVVDLTFDA